MIHNLSILLDSKYPNSSTYEDVKTYFSDLRQSNSRLHTQEAIKKLTNTMLSSSPFPPTDQISIVPILRGGLGMWESCNNYYRSPNTVFVSGNKNKGTSAAEILWISRPSELKKDIVIIDSVIATGDTIKALLEDISLEAPLKTQHKISILTCYCSPIAIEKLSLSNHQISHLIIGVKSVDADDKGYLIPYTNGDIGDKLYK